jgi:hypothetical protein
MCISSRAEQQGGIQVDDRFNGEDDFLLNEDDTRKPSSMEDEFAELDFRPKPKTKLLLPLVIIFFALIALVIGVSYLLRDANGEINEDPLISQPQQEEQEESAETGNDLQEEDEEVAEDTEEQNPQLEATTPPDYNFLEPAMHNWLIERTGDGDVILLHTDELDDVEHFFERFDIVEDNVIVYMIESKDEQFVTVLFGLPFSEWSTKVVFIWSGDQWSFLREEAVN